MTLEVALRHDFGGFRLDAAFSAPGGITALFGRSGSGKTTIINAIAGLLRPDGGRIVLDGTVLLDRADGILLPSYRRRIGYVFQEGRLFPHLTVRQNLRFGRWFAPRGVPQTGMATVVDLLGIGHLLERRPARLSGGEKQRVAIGRALLASPRLLLMDEPLASLDAARKQEILPYLERLRDEVRVPVLYVSHALPEVARLANTVVALEAGRVARAGPAAEVLADPGLFPTDDEDAGVVLRARVVGPVADGLTELGLAGARLLVPNLRAGPGTQLRVRIRARDVMIATVRPEAISALNILEARVAGIVRGDGSGVEVLLEVGPDRLLARITRRSLAALDLRPGLACFALVKSVAVGEGDLAVFDERDA
jgi:molybdate transport system ATP-binding protein